MIADSSERRLLPARRLAGPAPWVIGIMTFVMLVIAATGLALARGANGIGAGAATRWSVEIADGRGQAPAALAALRHAPGVVSAVPVEEAELRATLAKWLGPIGANADLPLPVLIDVALAPGASPDPARRALAAAVPSATFTAQSDAVGPLLAALRALSAVALAIVVMVAAATAAAVVLAARGALDTHRSTIEILHDIGATDDQVTRRYQRRIALDALVGALAGGLAAAAVLGLLALLGGGLTQELAGGSALGFSDLAILAALPLVVAGLAALVVRHAILHSLRANP